MTFLPALVALALAAAEKPVAPEVVRAARAKALVEALAKEDFAAAGKDFDATMKKVMPPDKLKAAWKGGLEKLGAFEKQTGARAEKSGEYQVVFVGCKFAKAPLEVKVVFDKEDKVTGFFFVPAKGTFAFKPPPYAKPETFAEEAVTVGAGGDWPLPATLALPKGKGPFPAVVLVHGSGPHDRDETIGGNKPLRDLAWGLATQGVAVLRYEKRTSAHGAKLVAAEGPLTLKEEVVDDALAAAALLRKRKEVDPKRVFVAGHSLGGLMAPEVGRRDPALAGLVLLAANSRPLEDLIGEQIPYVTALKGELTEKDKEELEKLKKAVALVKGPKLTKDTPAKDLPLGLPAAYWLALKAYDAGATAAKLKMPMLVLQGERDYQVTMEDFKGWKKALAKRENVTYKSYPTLHHLFMAGKGKGKATPDEYMLEGHVAKEVVDDVAAWVKKAR